LKNAVFLDVKFRRNVCLHNHDERTQRARKNVSYYLADSFHPDDGNSFLSSLILFTLIMIMPMPNVFLPSVRRLLVTATFLVRFLSP
jgi:hypothetical protein